MGRVARYKKEKKVWAVDELYQRSASKDDTPSTKKLQQSSDGFYYDKAERPKSGSRLAFIQKLNQKGDGGSPSSSRPAEQKSSKKRARNAGDGSNPSSNNKGKNKKLKQDSKNGATVPAAVADSIEGMRPGEKLRDFQARIGRETRAILSQQSKKNLASVQRKKELSKEKRKAKQEAKRDQRLKNLKHILKHSSQSGLLHDVADKPPDFRGGNSKFSVDLDSHESRKRFAKFAQGDSDTEEGSGTVGRKGGVANQLEALTRRVTGKYTQLQNNRNSRTLVQRR